MTLKIYGRLYIRSIKKSLEYIYISMILILCSVLCRALFTQVLPKMTIISGILVTLFLNAQRPTMEGGLVRAVAQQRIFIRYRTTEIVIFILSVGLICFFVYSKLLYLLYS